MHPAWAGAILEPEWSLLVKKMNVQLLSIEPAQEKGTFNVVVLIGDKQHSFTMKGETNIIGNQELHAIMGDKYFWKIFKLNQHLAQELYKLTAKVYNGENVELPIAIGEFFTVEVSPALIGLSCPSHKKLKKTDCQIRCVAAYYRIC